MTADFRPLSPHLQIYKPQLTSVLSILHRITGFALALGTLLIVWHLVAAAIGPNSYRFVQLFESSRPGQFLLLGWTFSLVYHLLNGIRHLVWDTGRNLDLKKAYRSGYLVIFSSIVLTVMIWLTARIIVLTG